MKKIIMTGVAIIAALVTHNASAKLFDWKVILHNSTEYNVEVAISMVAGRETERVSLKRYETKTIHIGARCPNGFVVFALREDGEVLHEVADSNVSLSSSIFKACKDFEITILNDEQKLNELKQEGETHYQGALKISVKN